MIFEISPTGRPEGKPDSRSRGSTRGRRHTRGRTQDTKQGGLGHTGDSIPKHWCVRKSAPSEVVAAGVL